MTTIKALSMLNGVVATVPIVLPVAEGTGKADDFPGEKGGVLGPGFDERPENTTVEEEDDV